MSTRFYIGENEYGDYVRYQDYHLLQKEIERLRAERRLWLDTDVQAKTLVSQEKEIEQLRQALHQVTAAYDKLLKRMGAAREAVGTDPHFEAGSQL